MNFLELFEEYLNNRFIGKTCKNWQGKKFVIHHIEVYDDMDGLWIEVFHGEKDLIANISGNNGLEEWIEDV